MGESTIPRGAHVRSLSRLLAESEPGWDDGMVYLDPDSSSMESPVANPPPSTKSHEWQEGLTDEDVVAVEAMHEALGELGQRISPDFQPAFQQIGVLLLAADIKVRRLEARVHALEQRGDPEVKQTPRIERY